MGHMRKTGSFKWSPLSLTRTNLSFSILINFNLTGQNSNPFFSLVDLQGGAKDAPPSGVEILSFSCSFRPKICKIERNNPYYFSRANQQKANCKIYSLTQCSLTVNDCDWHILAGNDERIVEHCLTRIPI